MKTNETDYSQAIAIIGMSANFPHAASIDQYWNNLKAGLESVTHFSDDELLKRGVSHETLNNPHYVKAGIELPQKEYFAAEFFGFSPREAEILDPQQRLLLECAWHALEDAGYTPKACEMPIGVYVGCDLSSYLIYNLLSNPEVLSHTNALQLTYANNAAATQIAYRLNLHGPCIDLNTACSSSLVAVHTACRSLLGYECDMALAGGASVSGLTTNGYLYQEGGILSPDGHCRSFDSDAMGTTTGQGAGLVLLKRYEDAINDNDSIYAIIRGSALNNDGANKVGYTAPSIEGQTNVMQEALFMADVPAHSIAYIECHGTATTLGDPIEAASLKKVYGETDESFPICYLGSVKANIGHLNSAAGIAGLIKTTLALHHGLIPPSINFTKLNPNIDFNNSRLHINTEPQTWPLSQSPNRAGVSSFGIGGTNAHMILEEHQPRRQVTFALYPFERKRYWIEPKSLFNQAEQTPSLSQYERPHLKTDYCSPRHEIDTTLIKIWGEVLGIQHIGIIDNFFELGGDSLISIQINSRIQAIYHLQLPMHYLMDNPTISKVADFISNTQQAIPSKQIILSKYVKSDFIPLSLAQKRLWFLEQLEGPNAIYNMYCAITLTGNLNIPALQASIDNLVARHAVFRTAIKEKDGLPYQIISPNITIKIIQEQLQAHQLLEKASVEVNQPFVLSQAPLLRVKLLTISPTENTLILTMHHIITDGWSLKILSDEIMQNYAAYQKHQSPLLPTLMIQYADYAIWQQEVVSKTSLQESLQFWEKELSGAPELLHLPTDKSRPQKQSYKGSSLSFSIQADEAKRIKTFAQTQNTTLFTVTLAAFYILMSRYSNETDIVLNTSSANRNTPEVEGLIGFFVNTLLLRSTVDPSISFTQFVHQVKQNLAIVFEHQNVPFDMLVEHLKPERSLSYTPLSQVEFILQNTPQSQLQLNDLEITPLHLPSQFVKFDLSFSLQQNKDELMGLVEFSSDLFLPETIETMVLHYKTLLSHLIQNENSPIHQVSFLLAEERNTLLHQWNNQGPSPYVVNKTVMELFTEQAQKTPNSVALTHNNDRLTYIQLEQKSNQLAHMLIEKGCHLEDRVALIMDRGVSYLVAMLGVLKAGAVFIPFNPNVLASYNQEILQNSAPRFILTQHQNSIEAQKISEDIPCIVVDNVDYSSYAIETPSPMSSLDNLAYIIYTSGSTGKPKGAMVEHRGMVNHLLAKVHDLGITQNDKLAQIAIQTFDVSVWQLLATLVVGGETVIITGTDAWEPKPLLTLLCEKDISIVESVPSHTEILLNELERHHAAYPLNNLRWYISNGEPMPIQHCQRWFRLYPQIPLMNAYGPTECSDDVTHYSMQATPQYCMPYVPIEKPIPNMQLYVLDEYLNPVPTGVIGELYIGGIGVGRGYFKDAERTAQAFINNPFTNATGHRLYRSGDLGRYHKNGLLEFLGRKDFQLKIRGFRIEASEIEQKILRHPKIDKCLITSWKDSSHTNRIIGYVIANARPAPSASSLLDYCKQHLPDFMVPAHLFVLDEFPLSKNGKIDRSRLPKPTQTTLSHLTNYVAPRSTQEKQLADLWAATLNLNKVGMLDNFFQIGGHSLAAAELVAAMKSILGDSISLRMLFENPTIEQFLNEHHKTIEEVVA